MLVIIIFAINYKHPLIVMNVDNKFFDAYTDILIMSILNKKSSCGYEIIKTLNSNLQDKGAFKETIIYEILKSLENKRYIDFKWEIDTTTYNRRKYYFLTELGEKYYFQKRAQWFILKELFETFLDEKNLKVHREAKRRITLKETNDFMGTNMANTTSYKTRSMQAKQRLAANSRASTRYEYLEKYLGDYKKNIF